MARPTLYINGTDFSAYANEYGYSIDYVERHGPNGGLLQSGAQLTDLLRRAPVITWALNDLPQQELSALLAACEDNYVSVTYFDTRSNQDKTGMFHPYIGRQSLVLTTSEGEKWFTGLVLTLTAR